MAILITVTVAGRKHPLALCEQCPLAAAKCVPSYIPEGGSKVAFVSRSPGKKDALYGRPFSNPTGSRPVLEHLLGRYGIKRDQIITTNVVLCVSDDPPKAAIAACAPRLESEIGKAQLIIAAGTEGVTSLTKYRTVFNARPFTHTRVSRAGVKQKVVVTNNPAAVIRNSDLYPDMVEDFRRAFDPPPPPVFPQVEIINEPDQARDILRRWITGIESGTVIASDLEWSGREIYCAGFAIRGTKAVVFGRNAVVRDNVSAELRRFYERTDIKFTWHNGKSDTKILRLNGIKGRVDEDTHLMSYALDERPGYHSLEYLLSAKFAWPDYEPKSVKHFKKTGEFLGETEAQRRNSERELYKYNGWDAAGTFQLYELLRPKLSSDGVVELYQRLIRAAERFRTVELNGFHYDVEEACNINEREVYYRLEELTKHIQEVTGHPLLNPRSSDQLKAVIYGEWGLAHNLRDTGKRKLSISTGKEVRTEILEGRFTCNQGTREKLVRWASSQRHYNKIDKLRGTYIEGLVVRAQQDGRIYCNFNVGGTVSGRASSNDPNFQNIAREGYEDIPGIRTLFLPSPGHIILSGDFSQAELRTCAKLSGDVNLLGIYRDSSRSLHKERAIAFYGEDYTKEQYVFSKNINFGVTYQQGAKAFAQMYHMPEREAQAYIDSWWNDFPTLKEWTNETGQQARMDGFIQSPFGHKRRFHLITDDNKNDVEREAINFLPQNIAGWLTISALIDLVDLGIRVINTVHDSIAVDCPADEANDVAHVMKQVMERQPIQQLGWTRDDIPFLVDVSIGPNWGDLHEMNLTQKVAA